MAVHFVGFRNDRYWNAVRVWGFPDFIHPCWDFRAQIGGDWAEGDTMIFAEGSEKDSPKPSWNDSERF